MSSTRGARERGAGRPERERSASQHAIRRALVLFGFLVVLNLLLTGCGTTAHIIEATIDETGLHLKSHPAGTINTLALSLTDGTPVQTWQTLHVTKDPLLLPMAVRAGAGYRVDATFSDGDRRTLSLTAATPLIGPISVTVQQLGSPESTQLVPALNAPPVLALPMGWDQVVLTITLNEKTPGNVLLHLPDLLASGTEGKRSEVRRIPLELKSQRYTETLTIHVLDHPTVFHLVTQFEPWNKSGRREWATDLTLQPLDPKAIAGALRIDDLSYPATPTGAPPTTRGRGTLLLPNGFWGAVGHLFGLPMTHVSSDIPVGASRVTLTNNSGRPLALALGATVLDKRAERVATSFAPPSWIASGGGPQVSRLITVVPGTQSVELPLYVRSGVRPGEYRLRLDVALIGSSARLIRREIPLGVRQTSNAVSATLLGTILTTLISLIWFARTYGSLMQEWSPQQLMRVAILAALLTGGAFATGLVNTLLAALIGPFNVFVGELTTEVWKAICLVLLITLMPRPGAFTLVYLTSYVLRGLLAGQVQIADLLLVGTTIGVTEGILWLSGLTRSGRLLDRYQLQPWLIGLYAGAAFGLADAILTWVQLAIGMGFYRLMYATWYIAATVIITGFLFNLIGTLLGLPLATELRRLDA